MKIQIRNNGKLLSFINPTKDDLNNINLVKSELSNQGYTFTQSNKSDKINLKFEDSLSENDLNFILSKLNIN